MLAAVSILLLAPPSVHGDDGIEVMKLRFAEKRSQLVVKELLLSSLLFDAKAYGTLKHNAIPTVVVVRIYVYHKQREQPISYRLLTMRVVYDLWEEVYAVRIDGPMGQVNGRFQRLDQAFKKITELNDVAIADLSTIAVGPHHYMAMVAELNPVSDATRAELKRWLTRSADSTSPSLKSSFFGSFVSIFINMPPPQADRVVRARSQPFYRLAR